MKSLLNALDWIYRLMAAVVTLRLSTTLTRPLISRHAVRGTKTDFGLLMNRSLNPGHYLDYLVLPPMF